ncbi:MAG: hypothetical protein ATN35_11810 [Epulopiscium sp. Nele67-Bin004]|nr:MAG: hypothetical protein ATN35_11810 [Epulopiscium sp. Nele67-Bin004]
MILKVIDKQEIGVRGAKIIYADENGGKLLVAPNLNLHGKPDYIFKKLFSLIPLELKSGTLKSDTPHMGDLHQLVVYFLIIEEVYKKRPPYGKLVYKNKTIVVKNTKQLRKETLNQIELMRKMLDGETIIKEDGCYKTYAKCKSCVCRDTVCDRPKK